MSVAKPLLLLANGTALFFSGRRLGTGTHVSPGIAADPARLLEP